MQRLIATPDHGTQRQPAPNHAFEPVVDKATRLEDQCAQFYPMAGETIAQTVMMKIEGAHHPDNIGTKQGATSRYAAY